MIRQEAEMTGEELPLVVISTFIHFLTNQDLAIRPLGRGRYSLVWGNLGETGILFNQRAQPEIDRVDWWLVRYGFGVRNRQETEHNTEHNQEVLRTAIEEILASAGLNPSQFGLGYENTGVVVWPAREKPPRLVLHGNHKNYRMMHGICVVK